jgi:hypothetical protein
MKRDALLIYRDGRERHFIVEGCAEYLPELTRVRVTPVFRTVLFPSSSFLLHSSFPHTSA